MPFKPLNDHILIQFLAPEEQSVGGLYLPPKAQSSDRAVVKAVCPLTKIEVGDGIRANWSVVNVGEEVLIAGRQHCTEVMVDGESCHVIPEEHILGVFEK